MYALFTWTESRRIYLMLLLTCPLFVTIRRICGKVLAEDRCNTFARRGLYSFNFIIARKIIENLGRLGPISKIGSISPYCLAQLASRMAQRSHGSRFVMPVVS